MDTKNPPYIIFATILIILSTLALYFFYYRDQSVLQKSAPIPELSPVPSVSDPFRPPLPTANPTPATFDTAPTISDLTDSSVTPTSYTPQVLPTPGHQTFTSPTDAFAVSYSSTKTLHQDQEKSGNRYTFYDPSGSITVHAGPDWSWFYPDRQFSPTFQVNGHDTFRYDINLQTIVDIDTNNLKYTIQCVHNAKDDLKTECDEFLSSFQFL